MSEWYGQPEGIGLRIRRTGVSSIGARLFDLDFTHGKSLILLPSHKYTNTHLLPISIGLSFFLLGINEAVGAFGSPPGVRALVMFTGSDVVFFAPMSSWKLSRQKAELVILRGGLKWVLPANPR